MNIQTANEPAARPLTASYGIRMTDFASPLVTG
jgi:hypothetical protein